MCVHAQNMLHGDPSCIEAFEYKVNKKSESTVRPACSFSFSSSPSSSTFSRSSHPCASIPTYCLPRHSSPPVIPRMCLLSYFSVVCFQVSIVLNKQTLYLHRNSDPENPIELAFQPKYGNIVAYEW